MARVVSWRHAMYEAMQQEMQRDETVFYMGETIRSYSVSKAPDGSVINLVKEFGEARVLDTAIAETAIIGMGVGAAMAGSRPICEILFADFLGVAFDEVFNQAATTRYTTGGQATVPMVIKVGLHGAVPGLASQHGHAGMECLFAHSPGLKIVLPSTPYDAKGLMISAIRDDNPVMYFENISTYGIEGEVPEEPYTVPLGKADVKRTGTDVTLVGFAVMVHRALGAAAELEKEGISCEVLDPRSLVPLDRDAILASVKKTGRVVVLDEGCKTCGTGAELSALIAEEGMLHLKAPIKRLAMPDTNVPAGHNLLEHISVTKEKIVEATRECVKGKGVVVSNR